MHHVSPYNEFGCNDFAHDRGYSRETMRGVAHYTRPEIKYKKGGVAKIIGAVVAVVATVFTAGAAAAIIGPTLLGSTMLASVAAGAIGGMVGGALGAFVGGGDIGRGAMFGAIGGAFTGGMGGFGGGDSALGSVYNAGGEAVGGFGTGAGAVGNTAGLTVAGGEAAASTAGGEAALGQTATQTSGAAAGLDGAVQTGQQAGLTAGLDTSALPGTSTVVNPSTGTGYSMVTPAGQGDMSIASSASGNVIRDAATNGSLAVPGQAAPGATGNWLTNAVGNKNVQDAGLKLGSQLLGSMAQAPGSGEAKSYLNDVKAMEQQSQQFNMSMANQKAGIGDKLQTNADNIDPQYYAMQGMTQTKNRDSSMWADQEARMRAQGASQDAIDAERHRQGIQSSQNQGTAYDTSYQSGRQQQNSTYATAGGMYGQIAQPSAGLYGAYAQNNAADAQAQKDWGYGIEQAGRIVTNTTKKPNQNTDGSM